MTRPVLVVESDPNLHGIGRLGEAIERSGLPSVRARAWVDDVGELSASDYAAIVVMGGEMHARDDEGFPYLAREVELLQDAVANDVPVLGICLGGQLLARALGAEVRPAERPETGWLEVEATPEAAGDPLLAHLREPVGVYQWHLDVFDLPVGAIRLARSDQSENQAFRFGERAWGLQFHPEVDAPLFAGWMQNYPDAPARMGLDRVALESAIADGSPEFTEPLFGAFCSVCVAAAN
jgi:GMP synthase (glutamine-hydrolysing)